MKRLFDFVASFVCLVLLWPLIAAIYLLILIRMGRPVFFMQQRPGLHTKPFYIYKFRTMLSTRDKNDELLADEKRMIPLGKFLRKYSLDELPQLINVLRGDLSLVGPRPLLMEYLPLYSLEQARRHLLRPGVTGLAQVSGRNAISWEDKFKLDVWYVDNQSFWLDVKILLLTVKKVFLSEGISAEGEVTMSKFTGKNS